MTVGWSSKSRAPVDGTEHDQAQVDLETAGCKVRSTEGPVTVGSRIEVVDV